MELIRRDAVDADVVAMTDIYNALLESTTIEWTEQAHTVDQRLQWQQAQQRAGRPVLVAEADAAVVGWASYGDFRDADRWPGYRFTVEHSIHVAQPWWGRGVGRLLIDGLIERAIADGKHVMVAGIDGSNVESIRFHEKMGFTVAGELSEIGRKHDQWLDLVLMQLVLGDGDQP
ncbi:MAG: GNAT family N-acetyltransferase [Acidimicrobiales bacterium]